MKYIKKFETVNEYYAPEKGDYVICGGRYTWDNNFSKFISNNIGVLQNNLASQYEVYYDYIDPDTTYLTNLEDMKYWSKDKDELEEILNTIKFNI